MHIYSKWILELSQEVLQMGYNDNYRLEVMSLVEKMPEETKTIRL